MLGSADRILVPKGAEYGAVCRGVSRRNGSRPRVHPIPIGSRGTREAVQNWRQSLDFLNKPEGKILLMGLAGSLSDRYRVGDAVICAGCGLENGNYFPCDSVLTGEIARNLSFPPVKGLTVDRVLATAAEKRDLAARTGYEVVDMEGAIVLQELVGAGVAIVRVISDGVGQDLPDLDKAFDENGDIRALELAMAMLKSPVASYHLIRGSLRGLRVLERIASSI